MVWWIGVVVGKLEKVAGKDPACRSVSDRKLLPRIANDRGFPCICGCLLYSIEVEDDNNSGPRGRSSRLGWPDSQ